MRGPIPGAIVTRAMTPASSSSDPEFLDLLPDALIGVEGDQRIVSWNHAAELLYGYTREEAVGTCAYELLASRFARPLPEVLEICARTGHWCGTVVNRARDGRAVTVDSRWSARRDERGECVAVISLGRELLAAPAEDGAAADDAPDGFPALAGAVAHDLNNVLAVVVNYAALLAGELEGIEQTGEERWATVGCDINEIRSAASRGVALSRTLFAASLAADAGARTQQPPGTLSRPAPRRPR